MSNENPDLLKVVTTENELKKMLVNYVGEKLEPESDEVNVEMIIQVMAEEFPEALLAVAEENFIRGYQQAMTDVEPQSEMGANSLQLASFNENGHPIQRFDESVEDFCKRRNKHYAWEGMPGGDGTPVNVYYNEKEKE